MFVLDGKGLIVPLRVSIIVIDVPEAPVFLNPTNLLVAENIPAGSVIANGARRSVVLCLLPPSTLCLTCCPQFLHGWFLPRPTASAHDDDTSHGDVVTHTLLPIQSYTAFTLGPSSGLLRNVYQLDYEFKRGYNVTVRANDKQGHSIQYRIQILVQNLNEVGVVWLLRRLHWHERW